MEINKRDRSALKAYFVEYALPTEANFAELIDGMINQKDDGIIKQPGSPLSLQASGDASSTQKVLNLYEDFATTGPAWTLSLRPRSNPSDPATGRKGLSIGTSGGTSRLFIDHATGRVGIGTVDPQAALHVAGSIVAESIVADSIVAEDLTLSTQPTWQSPTFLGSYSNYAHGSAGYLKDPAGNVHIRGMVHGSSSVLHHVFTPTQHRSAIFRLPEGYRPSTRETFSCPSSHSMDGGRVDVFPDGHVVRMTGVSGWITIGPIIFRPA